MTAGGVVRFQRGSGEPLRIPCGRCVGCRLEKSRQWAVRCMHEASLWKHNAFVTLTYSDENLPLDGSLDKSHWQLFMKRFRQRRNGAKLRYFHVGEYGEQSGRPHYHALLFNCGFPDRYAWRSNTYRSKELEETWGLGHCELGEVTFESAAYVARYSLKKITGPAAEQHYRRVTAYGEEVMVEPEVATMSRMGGIGRAWMEQWAGDVYPRDSVVARGHDSKPPRFYDKMAEEADPLTLLEVKLRRRENVDQANNTEERLIVREKVCSTRLNLFAGRPVRTRRFLLCMTRRRRPS